MVNLYMGLLLGIALLVGYMENQDHEDRQAARDNIEKHKPANNLLNYEYRAK